MNRHTTVTHISPLPSYVSRESVLSILHDHSAIITLNPLVTHHERCSPPSHALPDELESVWYEITDKIEYIPGTGLGAHVTYTACMHDIPKGLQTHIHAPAGLELRGRWQILGWIPGEERDAFEISADHDEIPKEGLYLREDTDLKCNIFLLPLVKRNIHKSHKQLVEKLVERAGHLALRKSLHVVSSQSQHHHHHHHHPRASTSSVGSASQPPSSRHQASTPVHRAETPDHYPSSQPTQFNEERQRAALEWQINSYSVSVTGGKQRNVGGGGGGGATSNDSHNSSSFMRRGRSQSPGYSFVKTSLGSSKRYTSEGPGRRSRRNESPGSFPSSTTSSRGVSLGRSPSWKRKRMGRDTPDVGE